MTIQEKVKNTIRDVVDFPKPGIVFKDISPIMLNPAVSNEVLDYLVDLYTGTGIDAIAGIESRGFLFGYPLAMRLNIPFVLIRKQGKLPYDKISHSYDLEYGSAVVEMHTDAIKKGDKILIHDDLLATGGSAAAAAELIGKCGGEIYGFNFLVSLDFLNGKEILKSYSENITNLVAF
ncbi:MAG: adenine phosphoribosyltransferase [Bacteroidota bacterium]